MYLLCLFPDFYIFKYYNYCLPTSLVFYLFWVTHYCMIVLFIAIIPHNVSKNSQILCNPLKSAFLTIFGCT